jgi:hypothetical protein
MLFFMAKSKLISPQTYAAKHGVAYSTVMSWIRDGLLRGVVSHKYPFLWYEVPEDATPPARKPGPKPAKKSSKK